MYRFTSGLSGFPLLLFIYRIAGYFRRWKFSLILYTCFRINFRCLLFSSCQLSRNIAINQNSHTHHTWPIILSLVMGIRLSLAGAWEGTMCTKIYEILVCQDKRSLSRKMGVTVSSVESVCSQSFIEVMRFFKLGRYLVISQIITYERF